MSLPDLTIQCPKSTTVQDTTFDHPKTRPLSIFDMFNVVVKDFGPPGAPLKEKRVTMSEEKKRRASAELDESDYEEWFLRQACSPSAKRCLDMEFAACVCD